MPTLPVARNFEEHQFEDQKSTLPQGQLHLLPCTYRPQHTCDSHTTTILQYAVHSLVSSISIFGSCEDQCVACVGRTPVLISSWIRISRALELSLPKSIMNNEYWVLSTRYTAFVLMRTPPAERPLLYCIVLYKDCFRRLGRRLYDVHQMRTRDFVDIRSGEVCRAAQKQSCALKLLYCSCASMRVRLGTKRHSSLLIFSILHDLPSLPRILSLSQYPKPRSASAID